MAIEAYNFKDVEDTVLAFWKRDKIYQKAKNKKGKTFYFLDGPPYTSGKVHLGIAWNKSLKDAFLRYKRMQGFKVWDRAGYDMHGLPTEHATEKELKVHGKAEIEKYGVGKFIKQCEKLSLKNLKEMNKDFIRLGVWMDFDDPYMTMDSSYIEAEWWLIKRVHEKGRLYEGLRTMHWCSNCATACAKHELEYANVRDNSIFVKMKVKGKKDEYLVIWTTTPWTIPFNLAIMVHPEIDYVKAKVGKETWIVAKALAGVFIQSLVGKKLVVIEEFKGKQLEGVAYEHPFADKIDYASLKKKHPKLHTVVLNEEYVNTSSGSGLVHCAPGCGQEDYEVGHANKLPTFNLIDEHGMFPEGAFAGLQAKKDDKKFVEALGKAVVAETEVEHDYPHCQRCHKPVVFRATKQWFFKVEDLKDKMITLNKKVDWVPEAAFNAFDSWLHNLRDNSITKQRYWGCPVPIWKCSGCGKYDVIGSVQELKEKAGKVPKDLHKPGIDKVSYVCACGKRKQRIPDILDVWVDAGSASFASLGYPQNEKLFKELFPADFILEGKDQIRGWFNLLLINSILAFDKHPYKAVAMHGFVNDAKGRKMSKSLGNYILPEEVISKYGADTFRYNFIANYQPGLDINYNDADVKIKNRHLQVLWNLHKFLIDMCKMNKLNPLKADKDLDRNLMGMEEYYILSRMNSVIKEATEAYDTFHIEVVPNIAEGLFLDLSRKYIQLIRDKAALGGKQEKEMVGYVIYTVLDAVLRLMAPTIPFITEVMFQNMKRAFGLPEESVHMLKWPSVNKKDIDASLELAMDISGQIAQAGLAAREKAQLSTRWPIKNIIIVTNKQEVINSCELMAELIKRQVNSKELRIVPQLPEVKQHVKPVMGKLGAAFGDLSPKIVAHLSNTTSETILDHFVKEGKYEIDLDGEKVAITRDHVTVELEAPPHLIGGEIKFGMVYIDVTREEGLVKEGFAREIMRHVQNERKKAGLEKKDKISLFVQVDEDLLENLQGWEMQIKEKVGAKQIKVGVGEPSKKHKHSFKGKIKGLWFTLFFDKV